MAFGIMFPSQACLSFIHLKSVQRAGLYRHLQTAKKCPAQWSKLNQREGRNCWNRPPVSAWRITTNLAAEHVSVCDLTGSVRGQPRPLSLGHLEGCLPRAHVQGPCSGRWQASLPSGLWDWGPRFPGGRWPEAALSAPRRGPLPRPCVSTEGPPKLARRASPSSAPHLGGGAPPHAPFPPGGSRSPARTRGWAGGLQRRERQEVGAAEAASHSDATVPEQGGRDTPVRSRCRGCYGVRGLGCSAMKLECDQATFPVLPTYQHKLQNKILI